MSKAKSGKLKKSSAQQRIARSSSRSRKVINSPSITHGGVALQRDATEDSRVIGGPVASLPHMRKFTVKVGLELDVSVARSLIDAALDPEWQGRFYLLPTPESVVEHLVFNHLRGRALTTLDGFADRSSDDIQIGGPAYPFDEFDCEVTEVAEAKE